MLFPAALVRSYFYFITKQGLLAEADLILTPYSKA